MPIVLKEQKQLFLSKNKNWLINENDMIISQRHQTIDGTYYRTVGLESEKFEKVCTEVASRKVCISWNDEHVCLLWDEVDVCTKWEWAPRN